MISYHFSRKIPFQKAIRQTSAEGYGLALLIVFLTSSILIAASTATLLSPSLSSYVGAAAMDQTTANQLAEEALAAAKEDILTQQAAGTTITTSYRYPSIGSTTISVPTYPGSVTTTAKGNYYVTISYARGFTYLLKAYVTVGSSNVVVSRLMQLSNPPILTVNAFAIYALRQVNPHYTGPAVQVRCTSTSTTTDIGFTASGDFDLASYRSCLGDSSLPLDVATGEKLAYGLRKLSSSYSGYAIKVRRNSDNATQDIGFDANGNLDTVTLKSFVGSNSAYVTTWYDQSGSGKDIIQSTNSSQPRIVNAGVIETKNNQPSVFFDGSNDAMSNTTLGGTLITGSEIRAFIVSSTEAGGSSPDWGEFAVLWKSGDANSWNFPTSMEVLCMGGATDATATNINNGGGWANGYTTGVLYQHTSYHDASNNVRLYRNGTLMDGQSISANLAPTSVVVGTGAAADATTYIRGYISELIFFNASVSNANRATIERNQGHYYNVSGLNDGFVTTWYDQSGNGRNLTQANTSLQPTINQSSPRISVYFDGASQYIDTTSWSLTTDKLTLLSAAQISSENAPSDGRAVSVSKTGDGNDWGNTTSSALLIKLGNQLGNARNGDLKIATSTVYGQNFQSTVLFTGSIRMIREQQNGLATTSTAVSGTGNLVINNLRLGQSPTGTAGHQYWKGNIYEVILFSTNLGTTDYESLESEQQTYYSIN